MWQLRSEALVGCHTLLRYACRWWDHAFFHCSKAYLRSQLWQPSTWPDQSYRVCFGPYFFQGAQEREALDADIERHYEQVREAVAGKRVEPD